MTESVGVMDRPLRVLVVDDSVFNRRSISEILGQTAEVEVIGKAADGEEALRLVSVLKPDAITLDLEMPRMDGFTFLRILMVRSPKPVIVVSSHTQKENVFRALELGALDFVAKPERWDEGELGGMRRELVEKVLQVRGLRVSTVGVRPRAEALAQPQPVRPEASVGQPKHVVAMGSSTGGPSALMEIFARLPVRLKGVILIAQHMPDKFTRTFAERLDRRGGVRVVEAQGWELVEPSTAYVCPGRRCMELEAMPDGGLRVRVSSPEPTDRYIPSADRLFLSVAKAVGARAVGVILTGMGDDGTAGARAILEAGGTVVAESERTAVINGMPGSAVRAGAVTRTLLLQEMADFIAGLGS
ncbi:chemotaxis-specific protein-glutamate methyltransferase CheB [Myxococcota bacterium]